MVARTLRITAPPDTIDSVHSALESVWAVVPDLHATDRMSVETAVIELTANVIQYANRGKPVSFALTIVVYPDRVEATLSDGGEVDDVGLHSRGMPDALAESGRGIPMIQALVDSVEHRRVEGFNHWTLVRAREALREEAPVRAMPSVSIAGVIDEMARQRALDELAILDTPPEERFDRVTRLAQQLFGVTGSAINLIDRDRQWSKSMVGPFGTEVPRENSACAITIQSDETLIISSLTLAPGFEEIGIPGAFEFYAGHPLYAPGGERIGSFCVYDASPRHFGEHEAAMLRDLAGWVQQELSVSQELSRAAEVQQGLLPQQLLSMPGWDIAGMCLPARAVGGDFYDWYPVGEGAAFTLADTMGKGIGAAIIAATVRAVLRSAARFGDVAGAVDAAAASLTGDLDSTGLFVTLFHGRLDMDSGELTYVDAGHGLSFVVRTDGEVQRLKSMSPPLGIDIETEWITQTVTLKPGDALISVSDGVLDLYPGVQQALDSVTTLVMLATSAEEIVDAIKARARGVAPDDVTVVVVRRDG
jgi:anti-sigma regulatory factor (Ser/Thr protein kinase)